MNHALILAAGHSQRFPKSQDKLWLPVHDQPLLYYTLAAFQEHSHVDQISLAVSPRKLTAARRLVKKHFPKITLIIPGGQTRQATFFKLFRQTKPDPKDIVLVHNAANPFVTEKEITAVLAATQKHQAAYVGHPVTDTIHLLHKSDQLVPRDQIIAAQTPQAARAELFQKAIAGAARTSQTTTRAARSATKTRPTFTDEVSLLKSIGIQPKFILADPHNFKITYPRDFELAKILLGDLPTNFRVGLGQDSHRFETLSSPRALSSSRPRGSKAPPKTYRPCLTLAGLKFPKYPKLKANSDGDVILHALFNALSSAIGERSISRTADPLLKKRQTKNSQAYLKPLLKKITSQKYEINNVSLSLEGARPRLEKHVPRLKKSLSRILKIPAAKIGLTLTSGEKLTPFGRGQGLACIAYVSLTSP